MPVINFVQLHYHPVYAAFTILSYMHCGVQCEVRYTLSARVVHVYVTPSLWSCSDVWDVPMFKLHCTHWSTSCTVQLLVSPLHDLQHNYE